MTDPRTRELEEKGVVKTGDDGIRTIDASKLEGSIR